MKAIRVHTPGGPDVMKLEDVPEPKPGAGQVVVKLEAAGVNYIDIYFRTGTYKAPLPLTPGLEGAGTVTQVGDGVKDLKAGDRVAYTGIAGSYAQMNACPADRLVKLPDKLSFRDGAAAMLQGMTAHYLTRSTYPLKAGDTCLVHAAAGGIGLLLCAAGQDARRHRDRHRLHRREGRPRPRGGRRPRDPLHQAGLRRRGEAHHRTGAAWT